MSQVSEILAGILGALTEEQPLEARLAKAKESARPEPSPELLMESAVLAALGGLRVETENLLAAARSATAEEALAAVELGTALVMLQTGHPTRVAGALERAEAWGLGAGGGGLAVLFNVLQAELLLANEAAVTAGLAASAALSELRAFVPDARLESYARLVAAEAALAAHQLTQAHNQLETVQGRGQNLGFLAARADQLDARLALRKNPPDFPAAHRAVDRAVFRLNALGARRELGLVYIFKAELSARDESSAPATWLAHAQPLLTSAGTGHDIQLLRRAFRAFGRRQIDRIIEPNMANAMDQVRDHRDRLRDLLSAQRDARAVRRGRKPNPVDQSVDEAFDALRASEESLIAALERAILDRERLGQLVTLSRELVGLSSPEAILQRAAAQALLLYPARSAHVVQVEESGAPLLHASAGASLPPLERLTSTLRECLRDGVPRVTPLPAEDRGPVLKVVAIPFHSRPSVLIVLQGGGVDISERDIEQLTVFASLVDSAISRATAGRDLQDAVALQSATLAAIREGVLSLDTEGKIRTVNAAALQLLGLEERSALGRRLVDFPGLKPLSEVLLGSRRAQNEVVSLPQLELLVRSQTFEGGVVAVLQELETAQKLAHRLVGSGARFTLADLSSDHPELQRILEEARRAAKADVPILITGESGTGKEMLAQAIHNASAHASQPFVGINVAALPRELLESELFGYERGAFTGARAGGHPGKFELAERGTVLLDEIGDMPLDMQAKLLRVLQERTVQRLGGTRNIPIRARVIATTHRDLEAAVHSGAFRLDLLHRLRVIHFRLPPLRERQQDIPKLVEGQLRRAEVRLGRSGLKVSARLMAAFQRYGWPGNVRELANLIDGEVTLLPASATELDRIPEVILQGLEAPALAAPAPNRVREGVVPFDEVERVTFEQALRHFGGNVAQAAEALGVAKGTLYNKIRRYQLEHGGSRRAKFKN